MTKAPYMPPETLQFIKRVVAKGKIYLYFDTGQKVNGKTVYKRLPALRDPSFGSVYASFVGGRTRRSNASSVMTVGKLIDLYLASQAFTKKLSVSSQKTYAIHLEHLRKEIGVAPAHDVQPRDIRHLLDKNANRPGMANLVLSVTGAMFKWARKRGYVANTVNPAFEVEPFELGSHEPWPENVLEAALASPDQRIRLAAHLLYFTAQRIGDVCAMRWSHIKNGRIAVKITKTGKEIEIPIHCRLQAELDRTPRNSIGILTRWDGQPVSDATIRKELKAFGNEYGLALVPHGIRKNAVIALLQAGCSVAETSAVSGQSFQMVEYYAKQRDQRKLSSAAILKWERT